MMAERPACRRARSCNLYSNDDNADDGSDGSDGNKPRVLKAASDNVRPD